MSTKRWSSGLKMKSLSTIVYRFLSLLHAAITSSSARWFRGSHGKLFPREDRGDLAEQKVPRKLMGVRPPVSNPCRGGGSCS